MFVVKRKTKGGSQALSLMIMMSCQRHLTDSDYRPIKPFWRVRNIDFISMNRDALLWLFVMCIDKFVVNFNEIKRNVTYRPILSSIPWH